MDPVKRFHSLLVDEMILSRLLSFLSVDQGIAPKGRLLDLGSGTRPYREIYEGYFEACIGLDRPVPSLRAADVLGSAESLPFVDESFDAIIFTEVLEHLKSPGAAMKECARVLKPGGRLFLTTPFLNPLHEVPHDYHRFTPYALDAMASAVDLEVERLDEKGGLLAFTLLFAMYLQLLGWLKLSRWFRCPLLGSWNPILWLTMIWPQQAFVWLWKRRAIEKDPGGPFEVSAKNWRPVTLGYMTFLRKLGGPSSGFTS